MNIGKAVFKKGNIPYFTNQESQPELSWVVEILFLKFLFSTTLCDQLSSSILAFQAQFIANAYKE